MEQAATVTTIDERGNEVGVPGFAALLRLRQGSSERASWLLDEVLGGTMITVGSDPACDWQIRAAFVPGRAFSILVVGGRAFVRSGPDLGVLLNGRPIDDGWTPVPDQARVDVGLARVEISLGYGESLREQTGAYRTEPPRITSGAEPRAWVAGSDDVAVAEVPYARDVAEAPYARDVAEGPYAQGYEPALAWSDDRERGRPQIERGRSERARPATRRDQRARTGRTRAGGFEPPTHYDYERPSQARVAFDPQRELEAMHYTESGEYQVAPALLEEDAPKSSFWRYALFIAITAGAYGGWLVLLDRL